MLSLKTVRNHVSNIFTKLQVPDRSAAIVKARDAGFGAGARRTRLSGAAGLRGSGPAPQAGSAAALSAAERGDHAAPVVRAAVADAHDRHRRQPHARRPCGPTTTR